MVDEEGGIEDGVATALVMHGLRDDDGYGSISSGPGKGYNARSYHTFPAVDYEQEKHQSSLSLSSREKGTYEKKTCSFSSLPSSKMARALLMSLLLTLALLLTYSSALPVMSSELLSLLRGRQLSTPPPSDWDDNTVPQNITDFDPESWVLSTNSFLPNHYQNQPYVANGYHGSRVPAEGVGFWVCSFAFTLVPPYTYFPVDNITDT